MHPRIPALAICAAGACSSADAPPRHVDPAPSSAASPGPRTDPGHLAVRPLEAFDRILEAKQVFVSVEGSGEPSCEKWSIAPESVVEDQRGTLSLTSPDGAAPTLRARFERSGPSISEACSSMGKDEACFSCDGASPKVAWFENEETCRQQRAPMTPTGCIQVFAKAFRDRARASLDGTLRTALLAKIDKKPFWEGKLCLARRPRHAGKRLLLDPDSEYPIEVTKGRGGTLIVQEVPEPNLTYHPRGEGIGIGCCDYDRYRVLSLDDHHAELVSEPLHPGDSAVPETWWFGKCQPGAEK